MSVAWQFYFSTLLIYLAVDIMAVWGLNLQFGIAGISSFAFIVFQAARGLHGLGADAGPGPEHRLPAVHRRGQPPVPATGAGRRRGGRLAGAGWSA